MDFLHRWLVGSILLLLSFVQTQANNPELAVDNISPELKKNANAVIRYHNTEFDIQSIQFGEIKYSYAITILNSSGYDKAEFYQGYDRLMKVKNISATIYDGNGNLVRKVKNDDIGDFSAISESSLFEDNRLKYIDPEYKTYPFTVEYSYTLYFPKGMFVYPTWTPIDSYDLSVEQASFQVRVPKNLNLRYKEINLPSPVEKSHEKSSGVYTWSINNFKAISYEPYSVDFDKFAPSVILAPDQFVIKNNHGSMSTWEGFGSWINSLNAEADNLPETTKAHLRSLVKDCSTDEERVEIIYEFLQNKMRYVNISVGLGGWQAIDAASVDEESYGDCKALSNYMQSALKAVGVESYYTLVYSGDGNTFYPDFPSNQFNHVILMVPNDQDTIWLECTSQNKACGFLGRGSSNKYALAISQSGSALVKTPYLSADENKSVRTINLHFTDNENGTATIKSRHIGLSSEYYSALMRLQQKEIEDLIYKNADFIDFTISSSKYTETKDRIPYVDEELDIEFRRYTTPAGNNLILKLYPFEPISVPRRIRSRETDILLRRDGIDTDTAVFHLPPGYQISELPENISIESEFGAYSIQFEMKEKVLITTRSLEIFAGEYDKSKYTDFRAFLEKVSKADKTKCMLSPI